MIKEILKLNDIQVLDKKSQNAISGGILTVTTECTSLLQCESSCDGTCVPQAVATEHPLIITDQCYKCFILDGDDHK